MNTAEDNYQPRFATRCRCGEMPGRCPGPANCPANHAGPACRVCGFDTSHKQDADDTWICADCEEIER